LVSVILYFPPINLGGGPPPPPGPQGGREAEGAVILSRNAPAGGAVITMSSGNTALLHVPATVTVPAGASSVKFRYDPLPVAEPTTVTVTGVYSGQTRTASVLILPPALVSLTFDSLQLTGGHRMFGSLQLDGVGPSDKDIRVALSNNHPAVQVPAELLLRGLQGKSFQVTTIAVSRTAAAIVVASFAGRTREAAVTVVPASLESFFGAKEGSTFAGSFDCSPPYQISSANISYTGRFSLAAKLTGPAPPGGDAVIRITSSNPQLFPVPATLSIVPNGIQAYAWNLTCPSPAAESIVNIDGTYRGVTRTVIVRVKPSPVPNVVDFTVSAVLYDGVSSNVVTRPTNNQPFRLCAVVTRVPASNFPLTRVLYAYQHSRGFNKQLELQVQHEACMVIEGLEIGEYVDVTLTVDPAYTTTESNESNNILKLRIAR
jgi:hypothetical protein